MEKNLLITTLGIGLVTLPLLLFFSFSIVEISEIGLDYSTISKTISQIGYAPGLYFLGLGHHFIKFPNIVQTLEFSLDKGQSEEGPIYSRTQDGLEVIIEISFQYLLDPKKLYELYMTFGEDFKKPFQLIALDVLNEITTKYTAYQFFYDRALIGDAMKDKLKTIFENKCFATIEFFQLRTVDLPDPFESAIQNTEAQKQDIERAKAEQERNKVEIQTMVKQAEFQKNATINLASGEAASTLQKNDADVSNIRTYMQYQIDSYIKIKNRLNLTNQGLIDFMKGKIIENRGIGNLIVNLEGINLNNSKTNPPLV